MIYYVIDETTVVEKHQFKLDEAYLAGRTEVESDKDYPLLSKYVNGVFYAYPGSLYVFDNNLVQWVFAIDTFKAQQVVKLNNIASPMILLATEESAVKIKAVYQDLLSQIRQMTEAEHKELDFAKLLSEAA